MKQLQPGRVVITGHREHDLASVVRSDFRADAVPLAGPTAVAHTPTVDIVVVIKGTLRLELDAGTVDLNPGDVIVQNATNHRWSNVGDEDVVIATVMLGSQP